MCTYCAAGEHYRCGGSMWNDFTIVPCSCEQRGHRVLGAAVTEAAFKEQIDYHNNRISVLFGISVEQLEAGIAQWHEAFLKHLPLQTMPRLWQDEGDQA